MSMTNLGLNQGPLVRSLFVIFISVLNRPSLLFLRMTFLHQRELNQKVVNSFQYFCAQIEVWNFAIKFHNQFYSFLHYSLIFRPQRIQTLPL